MNIDMTGHHFDLTDKKKGFINYKLQNKLQHFESRIHQVNFIITQENFTIKADCKITSDFGEFYSSAYSDTFEVSVESCINKMVTEVTKQHKKLKNHQSSKLEI